MSDSYSLETASRPEMDVEMASRNDTDILTTEKSHEATLGLAQSKVLDYIDKTLSKIINDIESRPCGKPSITLRRITSIKPKDEASESYPQWEIIDREVVYSFPGKTKEEARRFACIGKIFSEIYIALQNGIVVTKRDIYYRDPELFRQQATVDRYVDDIAYTCGVTRKDLNVAASPKGLFADGTTGSGKAELISESSADRIRVQCMRWILVVEKEATFKTLIESKLYQSNDIGVGVIITGKGYPDFATRQFLRQCLDAAAAIGVRLPVFGLFDCDPDGINIMSIYRYGSKTSTSALISTIPELIWLGLKPEVMFTAAEDSSAMVRLDRRDRIKAQSMLNEYLDEDGNGPREVHKCECRLSLQSLLMCGSKFELQALEDLQGGISAWTESRIGEELRKFGM